MYLFMIINAAFGHQPFSTMFTLFSHCQAFGFVTVSQHVFVQKEFSIERFTAHLTSDTGYLSKVDIKINVFVKMV